MLRVFTAVFFLCAAVPAHSAVEIRLWHGMSGAVAAELDRLIARYNASQKDYRVVSYFQGPYDDVMADDIGLRKGTRHAPHIVQVQDAATAEVMRSGFARPLWQLVQEVQRTPAAKSLLDARYLPAVAAFFSDTEGRLLALPFTATTPVLYYNRDAFRQAQLDPAAPPQTWYEMAKTLGVLVQSGQSCGLTTAWQSWVLVENFSALHNLPLATKANGFGGIDAALTINNPVMVAHIAQLAEWQKTRTYDYAGRATTEQPAASAAAIFRDGRSAGKFHAESDKQTPTGW